MYTFVSGNILDEQDVCTRQGLKVENFSFLVWEKNYSVFMVKPVKIWINVEKKRANSFPKTFCTIKSNLIVNEVFLSDFSERLTNKKFACTILAASFVRIGEKNLIEVQIFTRRDARQYSNYFERWNRKKITSMKLKRGESQWPLVRFLEKIWPGRFILSLSVPSFMSFFLIMFQRRSFLTSYGKDGGIFLLFKNTINSLHNTFMVQWYRIMRVL